MNTYITYHKQLSLPEEAVEIPTVLIAQEIKNKILEFHTELPDTVFVHKDITFVWVLVDSTAKYGYSRVDIQTY